MKRMHTLGLGLLVCLSTAVGAEQRTVGYSYTPEGLVDSIDGPRTDVVDVTAFAYDTAGNRTSMTNALGQVTQYTDYDGAGRLLRMVDPNGLATSFTYHPRGWLTSQTVGEGVGASTTLYDYDPVGNLTRITLPTGGTLDFTYDAANRLEVITDSAGNKLRYTLDTMGNRVAEQTEDPVGTVTRSLGRAYNDLNRLVQQVGADPARVTDYAYDPNGNLTGTTDGLNRTETASYDPLDRLIAQLDPAQGQTDYTYDDRDNLTAVTDPLGHTTSYAYNTFDEVTTQVSPDTGTTTSSYDAAGNLVSATDARNITVTYEYDALNRLTDIHYPTSSLDVAFTYDQGTNGIGRLTQMQDAAGTTDYVYDLRGNLIRETRTSTDAVVTVVEYAYDNHDQLVELTYPSGHRVHYGYDTLGRAVSATLERPDASTQVLASNVTRLPFGPIETLDYGNGLSLTRSYDQDYRLTDQDIPGILEASYTFDPVDNITAWDDLLDLARDQSFGYDDLDRLISADGSYGVLGYTYDAVGNRQTFADNGATDTYLYSATSNRLDAILGAASLSVSYDAVGNLTDVNGTGRTYDDTNRLVAYASPGITASYAYNGYGERVEKVVNGVSTHFRYASAQLIGEYDDSGAAIREYIYLDGEPLAMLAAGGGQGTASPPPAIDFNQYTIEPYSTGQDISGTATVQDGGATLQLVGNTWKRIALPKTITPQSILTFEFYSGQVGEIHAIGFDNGTSNPPGQYFQVYGTQTWGNGAAPYTGSGWQSYSIPVGAYLAGSFSHLVFVMDDDAASVGESRFRNVRIYDEATSAGQPIDFASQPLLPFDASQDITGTAAVEDGGATLALTGNTWKKIDFPYTVTADTVLTFDFSSDQIGEIHAIGFATGTALVASRYFNVYGTQNWGNVITPYAGSAWQSYSIPVGNYFTGSFSNLVFVMDDDASAVGDRRFRNLTLHEVSSPPVPPPSGEGEIYYAHADHLGAVAKLTDESGQIAWDADRMPFGRAGLLTANVDMPLRFPGQYYDDESGTYYNYFRDYDPSTGRYIQSDPIGLAGGLNTYAYVGGNPLNSIDPFGLETFGIGIQPPPPGAINHGKLNPRVGPGHVFSYLLNNNGQVTHLLSIGPSTPISLPNAQAFAMGQIPAISNSPISKVSQNYQWTIPDGPQLQRCQQAFAQLIAAPGNYAPNNQCTSSSVAVAQACGIAVPDGISPIEIPPIPPIFPGYQANISNPYGLQQQLNKVMSPISLPPSQFGY